jgi:transposase InsO family protein
MIQQEHGHSNLRVEAWCEALEVSVSGDYAWCAHEISPRQQADARLGEEIERVFVASRRTYGSHRVYLTLREQGICTSRKRVARLMRERGLRSVRARKRRVGLTKAGQSAYFVASFWCKRDL